MKYYRLDYCCATKEVGTTWPQIGDFIKGYNPEPEANGIFTLYETRKNGFPDKAPDLSGLKLANGAKFSDFLSAALCNNFFIINEKAKNVIETLHIDGECRIYSAQVTSLRKKLTKEYYLMQIISRNIRNVDFANSTLVKRAERNDETRVPIPFSSYEEFFEIASTKENPNMWIFSFWFDKIKMTKEFHDSGIDLFQIGTIDEHSWYVSQRFVDAIQENGLTGLIFEEVDL